MQEAHLVGTHHTEMVPTSMLLAMLLCLPAASAMRLSAATRMSAAATTASAISMRLSAATRMSAAATTASAISVEECVSLFGRLSDAQHVFTEPIRTEASGFEFSSNTAIKPKWLIAYVSREPCGEDVDLPTHTTQWSQLLFPDGASTCDRESFDGAISGATYTAPLGLPKWAVPGEKLVDTKLCSEAPSAAALDALWVALGGTGGTLQCDAVVATLKGWAISDPLSEAVLFAEFSTGLKTQA